MSITGLFKRLVPFFVTFAVGLFIASFFMTVAMPRFGFQNRGWKRYQENQRIRVECDRLREENLRIKRELEEVKRNSANWETSDFEGVPPVDFDAPPPPRPLKAPRVPQRNR